MIDPAEFLMIEPRGGASAEPVIDEITRKVARAWRMRVSATDAYRGSHTCSCGAMSDNRNHCTFNGLLTNSLCVHYVAHHRDEIPAEEFAKIAALPSAETGNDDWAIVPTREELNSPRGGTKN